MNIDPKRSQGFVIKGVDNNEHELAYLNWNSDTELELAGLEFESDQTPYQWRYVKPVSELDRAKDDEGRELESTDWQPIVITF